MKEVKVILKNGNEFVSPHGNIETVRKVLVGKIDSIEPYSTSNTSSTSPNKITFKNTKEKEDATLKTLKAIESRLAKIEEENSILKEENLKLKKPK